MSRRHNPRIAKTARCYTPEEVAELYSCHLNTVYNWLRSGLRPIDSRIPMLIHGTELNRFHRLNREKSRQKCGPAEVFCVSCKAPRRINPATLKIELRPTGSGLVTGRCEVCETRVRQAVGAKRLPAFHANTSDVCNGDKST